MTVSELIASDANWGNALQVAGVALWYVEGENEGPPWVCLLRANNGTFHLVWAGCDYTGWGCYGAGDFRSCSDRESAFSDLFVDREFRERDLEGFERARSRQ